MFTLLAFALLSTPTFWVGHHVVWSQVQVPLLGERTVRSDAWVLAEVHENGSIIRFSERPCRLAMGKVAGVQTSMPQATLAKLSPTEVHLRESAPGIYTGEWTSEWSEKDIDEDGHPGVSLDIDVPLCRGQVYVAMRSATHADARRYGGELLGEMKVDVAQQVLGASNACLMLGGKNSLQAQRGVFRYAPTDAVSCAAVTQWPDAAPQPGAR